MIPQVFEKEEQGPDVSRFSASNWSRVRGLSAASLRPPGCGSQAVLEVYSVGSIIKRPVAALRLLASNLRRFSRCRRGCLRHSTWQTQPGVREPLAY